MTAHKTLRPVGRLLAPGGAAVEPLAWEVGRSHIADARYYLFTTVGRSGPQSRPVLAVWAGDALFTTSAATAAKARNLAADPRCSVAILSDDMHVVLEGVASRVADTGQLEEVAAAYRAKYDWPVRIVDGSFDAPYGAPTAGQPPYFPYRVEPRAGFAFVTDDAIGPRHTGWLF